MNESGFARERELFELCAALPPEEWNAALARACSGDAQLHERMHRLLEKHRASLPHDAAFLKLRDDTLQEIGPYRLLQKLGEGGMGIVYAAEQAEPLHRRVAIKVLRSHASREVLARFDAERQALALMAHPNIAHIIDAGTTADRRPYIVMEYVDGEPITRYCARKGLPLRDRLELLCKVCEAVQHAHQKGLIHRDLKPSNILVAEPNGEAVPKVIDFGIAKALHLRLTEQTLETRIGSLLGTPDYMSPEQADLSPLDVDTRADVYALGAVLYELLTGAAPLGLGGGTFPHSELHRLIREREPPSPSRRLDGAAARAVRGELDAITLKAIEKDRNRRYVSVAELGADIQRFLDGEEPLAGTYTLRHRAGRFLRRHALVTALLAGCFLMLGTFSLLLAWQVRQTAEERDRANAHATASDSVTRFMLDIFRPTDASVPNAAETSARELLDRGRERFANDTALPMEIRLQLALALAQAYANLWLVTEASEMYEEAYALYEASGNTDPRLAFEILFGAGHWLDAAEQPEKARDRLHAALLAAESLPDLSPARIGGAKVMLAHLETTLGNFPAARELAAEYHAETLQRFGPAHRNSVRAATLLGHASAMLADFDTVARLIDEYEPQLATESIDAGIARDIRFMLGQLYLHLERQQDALRMLQAVYAERVERMAPGSLPLHETTLKFALAQTDPHEGIRLLETQSAQHRARFGDDAPVLIDTLHTLGKLYLDIPGAEPQAERCLLQALTQAERDFGGDSIATRGIRFTLAQLHARSGRIDSALDLLQQSVMPPLYQYQASRHPDFAALHGNPAFIALLGRFGARGSSTDG